MFLPPVTGSILLPAALSINTVSPASSRTRMKCQCWLLILANTVSKVMSSGNYSLKGSPYQNASGKFLLPEVPVHVLLCVESRPLPNLFSHSQTTSAVLRWSLPTTPWVFSTLMVKKVELLRRLCCVLRNNDSICSYSTLFCCWYFWISSLKLTSASSRRLSAVIWAHFNFAQTIFDIVRLPDAGGPSIITCGTIKRMGEWNWNENNAISLNIVCIPKTTLQISLM